MRLDDEIGTKSRRGGPATDNSRATNRVPTDNSPTSRSQGRDANSAMGGGRRAGAVQCALVVKRSNSAGYDAKKKPPRRLITRANLRASQTRPLGLWSLPSRGAAVAEVRDDGGYRHACGSIINNWKIDPIRAFGCSITDF